MNIIRKCEGRTSGRDHFGLEVKDIDEAKERINKFNPSIRTLKRPSVRPFAAQTAYNPDINIFDLSAKSLQMQKDVYADELEQTERRFSHFALRTAHTERYAEFYHEVLELRKKIKRKMIPIFTCLTGI